MPGVTLNLDAPELRYEGVGHRAPDGTDIPWYPVLIDELSRFRAEHLPAAGYDYATCDRTLLPFYAYEEAAFAYTDDLGEAYERASLQLAVRLHRLAGTPAAWYEFCRGIQAAGTLTYTYDGARAVGVDLYISPPLQVAANPDFLAHIVRIARTNIVPYTLRLNAVHIQNRYISTLYVNTVGQSTVKSESRNEVTYSG